MEDLVRELEKLGLKHAEAASYLAVLELGTASAGRVVMKSELSRATVYDALKVLTKKGLITAVLQKGERQYRAEPPERLATLIHLQQQELELRRRRADQLVTRLQVFHNTSADKPRIRYHEGIDGLQVMQQEYGLLEEDILQIVGLDTLRSLYGDVGAATELHEGQKVRAILVTDEKEICFPNQENIEFVCVPPGLLDVHGEMTVCGDRLVLFSYTSGLIAVEIHSKTIADTARATLELAWKWAQDWSKNTLH
jgi:predicted DNA-binding transcriptional regulator